MRGEKRGHAWILTVLTALTVFAVSCSQSDDEESAGGGIGGPGGSKVTGQVVSSATGKGVFGVTVSTNPTTTTDANGFFTLEGLEGDSAVLTFTSADLATTVKRVDLTGEETVPLCVVMQPKGATQTVSSDAGGTLREAASAVTLPPGGLVDGDGNPVTGDVQVSVTYTDPSTPAVLSFPGSFEEATAMDGSQVTLESFGFATYELTQGGEKVQLAPGETATIEYILPDMAQDRFEVGDEIELWEFVEDTAQWEQVEPNGVIQLASDGSGKKAWVAMVDHFSSWNCDKPITTKHCIRGQVLDNGTPVANAQILAVGVTYSGTTSATTGVDGSFCVDVKRDSVVRIEVRLNGAAAPLDSVEVTVPDVQASCATGGCTELPEPLSVGLDSCVRGRVTRGGEPVSGASVFIVPGEVATTDADGYYCGAAPANQEVAVFLAGQQSVEVTTAGPGDCPDACVEANLILADAPAAGDSVGLLAFGAITEQICLGRATSTSEAFDIFGVFVAADPIELEDDLNFGDCETTEEIVAGCTVTRLDCSYSFDQAEGSLPSAFDDVVGLDPGSPASVDNGAGAQVNLPRGDPASVDPATPILASVFTPGPGTDLNGLGFAGGQTINYSWPGGRDIGPFSGSVATPPPVTGVTPDVCTFEIPASGDLVVTWDPAPGFSGSVWVEICKAVDTRTDTGFDSVEVCIECEFPDGAGTGTIPAAALARLPADPQPGNLLQSVFVDMLLSREVRSDVNVPLVSGGEGLLRIVTYSETEVDQPFFDFPIDIPNVKPGAETAGDGAGGATESAVKARARTTPRYIPGTRASGRTNRRSAIRALWEQSRS